MQTLPIVGITQLEGGTQLKLILEFEVIYTVSLIYCKCSNEDLNAQYILKKRKVLNWDLLYTSI